MSDRLASRAPRPHRADGPADAAGEGAEMGRKILLVEDDRETAVYLVRGLVEEGHSVEHVADGRDGLFLASDGSFDLIILDRMLPGMDGLAALRAIRAAGVSTPVLILSALASVGDRIEGLESGSDDYLVKPFSYGELQARVNALLRRGEGRGGGAAADLRITVGDLEIDPLARSVKRAGRKIDLKPREYRLLEYLARNEGRVVTRTMLLEQVWDYHFDPGTNVIDVHISRLRRKLEEGFERPILHTVRGAGYKLEASG
jgi:two-component system OmpR family response regulator